MSSCVSSGLVFPVCLRSFWGRAVCVLLSARPALPGSSWPPPGLSAPSLASRRPSGSASLASHLPADAGAFLRSSALRPRVLSRSALRRFACLSRRAAARRPLSSCLCFSPARRLRRRRTLPFVPVPLLPFRQPGPCLRLCPSCRLWRPFPCLRFPCLCFFLPVAFGDLFPAFSFALPVAFGDLFSAFTFVLPSLVGPFLWLFLRYFFLFIVYGTSIAR